MHTHIHYLKRLEVFCTGAAATSSWFFLASYGNGERLRMYSTRLGGLQGEQLSRTTLYL